MHSMTGFGSGQAQGSPGTVTVEIRSVNSRYLDLSFRIPEELRHCEMPMRELIGRAIRRGKVEVRAVYIRSSTDSEEIISDATLAAAQATYERAQRVVPDLQPPTLTDLLQWPDSGRAKSDPMPWVKVCQQACQQALAELQANRQREGARLASVMLELASQVGDKVATLEGRLPELIQLQQERMAARMREVLEQTIVSGHITPSELSERINAEASLFSLRADVAEELARLRSHLQELLDILQGPSGTTGHGKRLDFLFQEMNREANTLGSKASHLDVTHTAIDLKLLVEQLREQIQNIE